MLVFAVIFAAVASPRMDVDPSGGIGGTPVAVLLAVPGRMGVWGLDMLGLVFVLLIFRSARRLFYVTQKSSQHVSASDGLLLQLHVPAKPLWKTLARRAIETPSKL